MVIGARHHFLSEHAKKGILISFIDVNDTEFMNNENGAFFSESQCLQSGASACMNSQKGLCSLQGLDGLC